MLLDKSLLVTVFLVMLASSHAKSVVGGSIRGQQEERGLQRWGQGDGMNGGDGQGNGMHDGDGSGEGGGWHRGDGSFNFTPPMWNFTPPMWNMTEPDWDRNFSHGSHGGRNDSIPPPWVPPADYADGMPFPHHGGGGGGSGSVMGNGIGSGCGEMTGVNLTKIECTDSPQCSVSLNFVTEGSLVCRTLYNMYTGAKETHNACIDPEMGLESDKCGCCGGECPTACNCTCTTRYGADGVWVVPAGLPDNFDVTRLSECEANAVATTLVAVLETHTCVTACPAE